MSFSGEFSPPVSPDDGEEEEEKLLPSQRTPAAAVATLGDERVAAVAMVSLRDAAAEAGDAHKRE